MSKLSFRARALDAAKPMPIYMTEELPDLPDYSAINRAVPQMPSGMEKEEECEHHLQRAICTGLIIPTPEVSSIEDTEAYDRLYTTTYKMPRQLIHMQPFAMEQDIPDYDMDSEDERFVNAQAKKMDLTPLKFEEMMDRLEKGSGQTVVTLYEAKGLLKEDDDLIITVYDYWLNKRLKTVVPLIPIVKTEHRVGSVANNPYLAFRRRTEKMQTRKNRKNDETSYEKMLKLRRDLSRTVTLLELVKRREKTKRELLHLTIEVFEKRYQAQDFNGQLLAEVSAIKAPRPAFAPIFSNQFGLSQQHWLSKVPIKEEILVPRKEKRQYKRRKHKENIGSVISRGSYLMSSLQASQDTLVSSEEELEATHAEFSDVSQCDSEGMFSFRRKLGCSYLPPTSGLRNWPWCGKDENGGGDKRFRYCPTSIATPRARHIGLARKRMGRGGDFSRPGKHLFRRNYRIGGFQNIKSWRQRKQNGKKTKNNIHDEGIFTTSEISLPELFADASVNLIPETELETNDSFAILDKLSLDDDFIKKEPEISLVVDTAVDKTDGLSKTEGGQNYVDNQSSSFQKHRLKIDKNIFEFSETDFLKYETDCDVDDLLPELVQNDVVGCCGLFGLTPNSRFNLVSPTYLPLESDKIEGDQLEEVLDGVDDKLDGSQSEKKPDSPNSSNYGQIADITSDIENHEVTLQLKMNGSVENNSENVLTSRLNMKNDFSDAYQLENGTQIKIQPSQQQAVNYTFALNHHNYTISGPPGYNFKQHSIENTQNSENQVESELQGSTGNAVVSSSPGSSQLVPGNPWKPTPFRAGPGILRTYKGNNARNAHLTTEGNLVVQDSGKKTVSNGPATIGFNQRRVIRAASSDQSQSTSISAQNPTVTQLVTSPSIFTFEGMPSNQNFMAANQTVVVNQGFMTTSQNVNFLGTNQTINYISTNPNGNQLKQVTVPQRKVSLLVNPSSAMPPSETAVAVDLGNDSLETVDIETSEGDETEAQTSGQEITVDNTTNQMNVRKNNSLPMEVT